MDDGKGTINCKEAKHTFSSANLKLSEDRGKDLAPDWEKKTLVDEKEAQRKS